VSTVLSASDSSASRRYGELYVALLFTIFAAAAEAGFGAPLRLLFPAASMILASWLLATDRREEYFALCLWLFLLTPWLRRVVDYKAGWAETNLLMLAPYAATTLCVFPMMKDLSTRRFAYSSLFFGIFVSVLYGLLVAFLNGRTFAGAFDCLRWAVPPCFCLFVALDEERRDSYQATVRRTFLIALVLLSIYSLYQFVVVPPWDAFWMLQSRLTTIGRPEPYLVRVFGTMNSPGSFANYLMAGLLLVMPARSALRWPALVLGATALMLTLVRTSWLGFVCGLVFLLGAGRSNRARFSILAGLAAVPLVLLIIQQVPYGDRIVGERMDTLNEVQRDDSFIDRTNGYREFFLHQLPSNPGGDGLGAVGAYQSYLDHRNRVGVDGEVLEVGIVLGAFAGTLYLAAILILILFACWVSITQTNEFLLSCGAVVFAETTGLLGGTMTVGEAGFIFWLAMGFCLGVGAATSPARATFQELQV
jgi:hypothetical protein